MNIKLLNFDFNSLLDFNLHRRINDNLCYTKINKYEKHQKYRAINLKCG